MSKTRDTGNITNVIKVDATGNVSFVSGSTTLATISTSGQMSGSLPALSSSYALSASYVTNAETLDGLDSTVFTLTSSFNTTSASLYTVSSSAYATSGSLSATSGSLSATSGSLSATSGSLSATSGSLNTRVSALEVTGSALSSSILSVSASSYSTSGSLSSASGSFDTRISTVESKYATTGSNTFIGTQIISGSILQSGSFTSTGTLTAQTLVVQTITSSVVYSSGSNIFGNSIGNSQVFTGSVLITGSLTIAGASSATSYSGTTIFGSTIACSPIGCFATSCATSFIGGTMSGTTIYGSTAVCSPVGKFTSCIDAGSGNFSSTINAATGITIGTSGTNDISWGTAGGIKLSRTNVGAEYALSQRWTGTLAYIDIGASCQWNGGVAILPNGGGNVGIGTDTPTDGKFVVAQSAIAATYKTDIALVSTNSVGTNSHGIDWFDRGIGGDNSGRISVIRETSGTVYAMAFYTANASFVATERMRITSTGIACFACQVCAPSFIGGTLSGTTIYGSTAVCSAVGLFSGCVGIGNTSPTYQLDMCSGTTVNQRLRLQRGSDDTNQNMLLGWNNIVLTRSNVTIAGNQTDFSIIQCGSDGARVPFYIGVGGISCFACGILVCGNIGLTSINSKFYQQTTNCKPADSVLDIYNTATDGFGVSIQAGANNNNYALAVTNYANTPLLHVAGNGYVGIGCSTPNAKLTINSQSTITSISIYGCNSSYISQVGWFDTTNVNIGDSIGGNRVALIEIGTVAGTGTGCRGANMGLYTHEANGGLKQPLLLMHNGNVCLPNGNLYTTCTLFAPGTPIQVVTGTATVTSGAEGTGCSLVSNAAGTTPAWNDGLQIASTSFTPKSASSKILVMTNSVVMWERSNVSDQFYLWASNYTDGIVLVKSGQRLMSFGPGAQNGGIINLNGAFSSWGASAKTISFRIGTTGGAAGAYFEWNPYYGASGFNADTVGNFTYTIMEIAQ